MDSKAAKVLSMNESRKILEKWQNRAPDEDVGFDLLGSRFIHTDKSEETGIRAKSRWCPKKNAAGRDDFTARWPPTQSVGG